MSTNITHLPFSFTQDSMPTENLFQRNNISDEYTLFLCCVYSGNTLLGLSVILVMWAIWPEVRRSLGLPVYAVNLLCAAILECLSLPFGVAYLLHSLDMDPMGCKILGLLPNIAQRTATMFTLWIFIVRYVAVSHPLKYKKFCKCWVLASVSITFWLTTVTISVLEQVLSRDKVNLCFPIFRYVPEWPLLHLIISFLFSHLSLIPLCVFAYLISHSVKNSDSVPTEQYKRISRLLAFVVVNFGIFFCPMHVVLQYHHIIMLLGKSSFQVEQKLILSYQMMFAFNTFSVMIAPFFYIISSSTVKTRLKELLKNR
ncbi:G-protein coupled receptor 4-like [Anomaloglossus baeobatrachus]|uniref:G-protein coupled receptor 4-like n=1 Tax=Anomaloglossus baeobatrachus TaxID=238106 RepID=UPI003F501420